MSWPRLTGTCGAVLVSLCSSKVIACPGLRLNVFWLSPMETLPPHWTTCAVPLLGCPQGTKVFPVVHGSLLCFLPLAVILSLGTAENSLALSLYLFFRYLDVLVRHHIPPRLFSLGSATWHSHIGGPSGKLNSCVLIGLWEWGELSTEFSMGGVVFTVINNFWLVEKWVSLEKVL